MKKLFLTALCASSFTLVACSSKEKVQETAPQKTASQVETVVQQPAPQKMQFSQQNTADIKSDLTQIQVLSNKKAQEGLNFQSEALQALQTNKQEQVMAVLEKMQSYVDGFNQSLTDLPLKSSEADQLRHKIIQSNTIGFELAKESAKKTPDTAKIKDLQQKLEIIQKELLGMLQKLQAMVNPNASKEIPKTQPH